MGLSASQARLLSITARLSANEYESQQISNAKMRLATQSEQASQEYIAALNLSQMNFLSFDAQGDAQSTNLTANVLFQYADMKNQYVISNAAGQVLLPNVDAENYKNSKTLDEFLACYGITKTYKTAELAKTQAELTNEKNQNIYNAWDALVTQVRQGKHTVAAETAESIVYTKEFEGPVGFEEWYGARTVNYLSTDKYKGLTAEQAYMYEKYGAYLEYNDVSVNYKNAVLANYPTADLINYQDIMDKLSQKIADCTTFQTWCSGKARDMAAEMYVDKDGNVVDEKVALIDNGDDTDTLKEGYQTLKDAVEDYYELLDDFEFYAEDAGFATLTETYTYSDPTQAKWYTNLWYRLNGDSSNKKVPNGNNANYVVLAS